MLEELVNYDIIKKGEFVLKSGKQSIYYINLKGVLSYPLLLDKMCNQLANHIVKSINTNVDNNINNYAICGVPDGAIPFASIISNKLKIPMLLLRKEAKTHGMCAQIEGNINKSTKIILIEDVVTTGLSLNKYYEILKESGYNITNILSFIKRNNIPLKCGSIEVNGLLTVDDKMLNSLFKRMDEDTLDLAPYLIGLFNKKHLCVAIDVSTQQQFIDIFHKVGPYVKIIKTHIDIISDFTSDFIDKLIDLKHKYNVILWEDRKFADIGHIVKSQLDNGIYKISSWADIISVHLIAGPEILSYIKNCYIVVVCSMSSRNTFADYEYAFKCGVCLRNAIKYNNRIVGVVSQYDLDLGKQILNIVPGLKLTTVGTPKNDAYDQQYSDIKNKEFGNIFVVGRDIINSSDIVERCQKYVEYIRYLEETTNKNELN